MRAAVRCAKLRIHLILPFFRAFGMVSGSAARAFFGCAVGRAAFLLPNHSALRDGAKSVRIDKEESLRKSKRCTMQRC